MILRKGKVEMGNFEYPSSFRDLRMEILLRARLPLKCALRTFVLLAACAVCCPGWAAESLATGFRTPPSEARLHCYWWWLNGNVTKQAISRDLEEMKAKGFGGTIIVDGGGAEQGGHAKVPAGPMFGGPAWREAISPTAFPAGTLKTLARRNRARVVRA